MVPIKKAPPTGALKKDLKKPFQLGGFYWSSKPFKVFGDIIPAIHPFRLTDKLIKSNIRMPSQGVSKLSGADKPSVGSPSLLAGSLTPFLDRLKANENKSNPSPVGQ
tara:strand:- start:18 stop:338 length:321 start_codon:yes stop_codon:yes gene_type:complete